MEGASKERMAIFRKCEGETKQEFCNFLIFLKKRFSYDLLNSLSHYFII